MNTDGHRYELRWGGRWWDPWTWNTWHVVWVGDHPERLAAQAKGLHNAKVTYEVMERAMERQLRGIPH
jgi:hypothetical protein